MQQGQRYTKQAGDQDAFIDPSALAWQFLAADVNNNCCCAMPLSKKVRLHWENAQNAKHVFFLKNQMYSRARGEIYEIKVKRIPNQADLRLWR